MLTATIICPHCRKSDLATFAELVEYGPTDPLPEEASIALADLEAKLALPNHHADVLPAGIPPRPIVDDLINVAGLLVCQGCNQPMLATLRMTRIEKINHRRQLHKIGGGIANRRFSIEEITLYPEPPKRISHASWPDKVQRLMPDIDLMLQSGIDPSIIVSTCRTVIDLCMKDLGGTGKTIFERIDSLKDQGVITLPIATWAHRIRSLGADATHDGEGTEQDAREFVAFLRLLLKVAYELAADVKKASNISA